MKLKTLFKEHCNSDSEVSSIEIDSRLVAKGSVFFALKGSLNDGVDFIESAIDKGAIAVICRKGVLNKKSPEIIEVENDFEELILALQKFYPNLPENILAVTGTNGKTSVAYFIYQMQEILGKKSAAIGTIGISLNQNLQNLNSSELTTPDIVSLYKNLAILKENGINDVAIEASSVGLDQGRMAGINIGAASFTNFTQDHLDYHKLMTEYFNCKMLLFKKLKAKSPAIINADIDQFSQIKKIVNQQNLKLFSYGIKNLNCDAKIYGQEIIIFDKKYPLNINLLGQFQQYNILCAILMVISYYNLNQSQIDLLTSNLHKIKAAKGRLELVSKMENGAQIFIDYAHTPDALQNVLENAKEMPHNNLHVLFGCGGNRDKSKRPQMGKIASNLADFVIVTDDNPRNEDANIVRFEIMAVCDLSKTFEIGNRKEAIKFSISQLQANDILILAGKGHEKYQVIGDEKIDFDEEKIVSEMLSCKMK